MRYCTSIHNFEEKQVAPLLRGATTTFSKKNKYINMSISFDIETSSFYYEGRKCAIMYIWQMCINGFVFIGRSWKEFTNALKILEKHKSALYGKDSILVIYVHNLAYEFQFIRKHIEWSSVFSLEERKPCRALSTLNIEFRCSYILTGCSLELLSKRLQRHKFKKLVGFLDYSKIRTPLTPLNKDELEYCANDVLIIWAYIKEQIEYEGNITKLPNTKTGYVRRLFKKNCYGVGDKSSFKRWKEYRSIIETLTIEEDEYIHLTNAFQGGFTHANSYKVGYKIKDVYSFDFTSSYPAVMVLEKFPMSKGEKVAINSIGEIRSLIRKYCFLIKIHWYDVSPSVLHESPISSSRCEVLKNACISNGRVVSAKEIVTTITELDLLTYEKFYNWKSYKILEVIRYRKSYLPKKVIETILELYVNKTTLKGVEGSEYEYLLSKELVNSCYGMIVTSLLRDEIIYNGEWDSKTPNIEEVINKYNNSKNRFLYYPWGVWVTAYARFNLFSAIYELQMDYIYSDTDSVKFTNFDEHRVYFDKYNEEIQNKIESVCRHYKLDKNLFSPKTIKGEMKTIGVWDYEGKYEAFKTLGAKRYLYTKNGAHNLTVSGVNKESAIKYMASIGDVYDVFEDGLYIPNDFTGKNTHTYIDEKTSGIVVDYMGLAYNFIELSAVHLEKCDFTMSLSEEFKNFLEGVIYV